MAEVEFKNVRKSFQEGRVTALRDTHLRIPDGVFAAVVGPSGCGKTTLLRIVAGLEMPDEGEILIGGKVMNPLPPKDRNIAMVFQNYALYPHKKVFENISMGLRIRRLPKETIKNRVEEVSRMLKIGELLQRYPRQLSGGQQQRVALARALVREPDVFLLDEPLSNLDVQVRELTRTELKKLFKGLRATVLYVTHDQTEAMTMSDLLVVMDEGTIRQIGDPLAVYTNPSHKFVAEFIGSPRINMMSGRTEAGRFISGDGVIAFDTTIKQADPVWMGVRPEQISLPGDKRISLQGRVLLVEPMGLHNLFWVRVGENDLRVLSRQLPAEGTSVSLSFSPEEVCFFDGKTGQRIK